MKITISELVLWCELHYPEIVGIVVTASIFSIVYWFDIFIDSSVIEAVGGLLSQVLSTYLGLVLTAFAVLFGLNVEDTLITKARELNKSKEVIEEIKSTINNIYKDFFITIKWLATGTLFSFASFFISSIGISAERADLINNTALSILSGFMITGTINLITTVQTILTLPRK